MPSIESCIHRVHLMSAGIENTRVPGARFAFALQHSDSRGTAITIALRSKANLTGPRWMSTTVSPCSHFSKRQMTPIGVNQSRRCVKRPNSVLSGEPRLFSRKFARRLANQSADRQTILRSLRLREHVAVGVGIVLAAATTRSSAGRRARMIAPIWRRMVV